MKKKPSLRNDTFTAAQVGTLIEDLRGDMKIFGEGLTIVGDDVRKLTRKVDIMFEELGRQSMDIHILKTDVSALKIDVSVLKTDMKIVKTDTGEIKDTLQGQDKRIDRLETMAAK